VATQPSTFRSLARTLTGERLLAHNLVVAGGTLTAGVLGVAFQSAISHQFRPADYGSVFAVVTLITFIGLPASAFTLLTAREISWDRGAGERKLSSAMLRQGNRSLLLVGFGLAVAIALTSPFLGGLLGVTPQLLLAAAVGIPFGLAAPLLMGAFQGEQRFVTFAGLLAGQAALKLIGALALGYVLGPIGVIAGISLATVLIYLAAATLLRRELSNRARRPWLAPALRYMAIVLPSTLALSLLLSTDVFVVKHYFPTQEAGQYSAVAALGRAIFWGASGIAAVLFPKIVLRNTQSRAGSQLVVLSLILVGLVGLAGFGFLWVGSSWLLTAFAGAAYASASGYLPMYAVAMTLLGGIAVLIAVHQSRGKPGFLLVLVPLALLEPALLLGFHRDLTEVVQILDLSMGLLLGCLALLYWVQERFQVTTAMAAPAASAVSRVGVNQ
jgi:O-antigen/teichoic acid export membrane protein